MTRILVISDIHNRHAKVQKLLDTVEYDRCVLLGDFFDDFNDFPEDARQTYENIVFLNRRGKKLSRVMIFTIIKNLADKIKLEKNISPHTFRHSFASALVQGGADLRTVQEMLGHESILTTEIYTHLDKGYLKDTINKFHPRS